MEPSSWWPPPPVVEHAADPTERFREGGVSIDYLPAFNAVAPVAT